MTASSTYHEPVQAAALGLPKQILLVEDSSSDVALVRVMLSESGGALCRVTWVPRLADARAHLLAVGADCVLLDLSLPDGQGMETVEGVLDIAPDIPIIVLSGSQDERLSMAALTQGAQDYLIKGQVDGVMIWRAIRYAVERKRAEVDLRHQARHDSLTGLANRALFLDRLHLALSRLNRDPGTIAVLMGDLDRFKWVNDSLGHEAGDDLLKATARRVEGAVRPTDLVARLGGDEFVVLCEDIENEGSAAGVAERIQSALGVAFPLAGTEVSISASLGIVTTRDATAEPEGLLRDADVAMYRAKSLGKGRCEPFDAAMREASQDRLFAEHNLRRAIEGRELAVYYQPVVHLADGRTVGAEALVRWQHPDGGIVLPDAFIGLAEETGLIMAIGDYVLETACHQLARWDKALPTDGTARRLISVNLSARQLVDPDLIGRVAHLLAKSGADPEHLCLELTETAILVDESATLQRLIALKELGVILCLDDFGTGYSSLSHLTRLPIDVVKVDRSFTEGLDLRERDTAIVQSVVALGRTLGMVVIAEGVETEAQADHLRNLDCEEAQGYLFGRPDPRTDLFAP